MDREQRIATMQKIIKGEATPEDLKDRRLVYRIFPPNVGKVNGLYVNGELSKNEEDWFAFKTAMANHQIKVIRT